MFTRGRLFNRRVRAGGNRYEVDCERIVTGAESIRPSEPHPTHKYNNSQYQPPHEITPFVRTTFQVNTPCTVTPLNK